MCDFPHDREGDKWIDGGVTRAARKTREQFAWQLLRIGHARQLRSGQGPSPWPSCSVLFSLVSWALLASTTSNWGAIWKYRNAFWQGWLLTVALSVVSLVLSTLIGLVAALARRSSLLIIRYISTSYIECVRGMPLLVLILVLFYVVANALNITDRFLVGVVVLSLFAGAYIAEIIRAGIESVGMSQRESARAIGLTTGQRIDT